MDFIITDCDNISIHSTTRVETRMVRRNVH